ncbi:MAG TPA: amino acid adenylation domain-containing protein, partial [Gemmatimonadales bacterium]|nr:amino acid adenylation domain-containing protein [Gemmatimonadales bacterium]
MTLLQDYVIRQAERRPDAPAIVFGAQAVTYGALDDASTRLARLLLELGCGPGDRVALLLPKSPLAITAMLGVLKAGCVYTPVDLKNPPSRVTMVLDALEARVVLASEPARGLVAALAARGVVGAAPRPVVAWLEPGPPPADVPVAATGAELDGQSPTPVPRRRATHDVAHILFTSGSTGTPKGVMITHSNVVGFVEWATRYFDMAAGDRVSGHSPLHFDLSTFDVYGAFAAGATLYPIPPELNLLPHKVAELIRSAPLTQWFSVPSILMHMAKSDVVRDGDFPALRRLLWCGEAFPTPGVRYWMRRLPHVTFTNLYGPTEATIASSYYRVPACPVDDQRPIPIGRGCDGEELLVLDDRLRPVAPGDTGDLYIRGVGLSPGYWRDPERTRAAFLPNPYGPPGDRIYRTGDLARVDGDGTITLVGRSDFQIKSRGYRIELEEIESVLHGIETVRQCAVVGVETDGFEGTAVACAYVSQPGADVTPADLRRRLAERLPPYMVPSRWRRVDQLPLNPNGKVDRRAVKE